jgi:hypothetical protein
MELLLESVKSVLKEGYKIATWCGLTRWVLNWRFA